MSETQLILSEMRQMRAELKEVKAKLEDALKPQEFYSVSQFAKLTGKSPETINGLLNAGQLEGTQLVNKGGWSIPHGMIQLMKDRAAKNRTHITAKKPIKA